MKKVLLMAGLLAGMTFLGMAQTAPAKKETKKEMHHKGDSTSKAGGSAHKAKPSRKH